MQTSAMCIFLNFRKDSPLKPYKIDINKFERAGVLIETHRLIIILISINGLYIMKQCTQRTWL